MDIPKKTSGVPDGSNPKNGSQPKDEELLAKKKKRAEDEDEEDQEEEEDEDAEEEEDEEEEEDLEEEELDEDDEEDLEDEDEDEDELDEEDEDLDEEDEEEDEDEEEEEDEDEDEEDDEEEEDEDDEEEDEEEEEDEGKGKRKAKEAPKRRGRLAVGEGGEGPPDRKTGRAPPVAVAVGAAGAAAVAAGAVAAAATPEAKDASAAAEADASSTPGARPATARLKAAARAPSKRRSSAVADAGTNRIKLVALGVCLLLFLACVGVGGFAIYKRYFWKPPEEPTKITRVLIDYADQIKSRDADAKNEANAGKDANEKNDYAAALEHYKKALDLWSTNVEVIQNLRAREEYSGPEYALWERVAANDNMFIHDAKEQIFQLELLISRKKVEDENKNKKQQETPVLKEDEFDLVPVDDPAYEAGHGGQKRMKKVPKAKPALPAPVPKEDVKAAPAETKTQTPAPEPKQDAPAEK